MKRKLFLWLIAVVALFAAGFVNVRARAAAAADVLINSELLEQLNDGSSDFFIKMADNADASDAVDIEDRDERLWYLYNTMADFAAADQADIQAFLERHGVEYVSFWVNNSIYVKSGDLALARQLAQRDDVAYLRPNKSVPLVEPVFIGEIDNGKSVNAIEWGVQRINAPAVWSQGYDGTGIVVANIDTGVRYTHNALNSSYRGNNGNHDYDWWDPDLVYSTPTDNNGHGTHTMGTIVGTDGGSNQIGVAPGARWIAAQGCDTNSCSDFDLTSSAQWVTCPTRVDGSDANCALAPHVVNNSWGGGGGNPWYQSYVDTWFNAGIAPVFSAGNSGPGCSTVGSPSDYKFAFSVGATNSSDTLAGFSSRGPSSFVPRAQPDLSAPGVSVRSAYHTGDSAYASLNGTSMAAPHVAGTVALMMDKNAGRSLYDYHFTIIGAARTTGLGNPGSGNNCGGTAWNDFNPANNVYGHGILDALAAVNATP